MSFFKFDEKNVNEGFSLIAEGEYEAIVQNVENKTSQKGNPYMSVDFEIRSDVQQPHAGQKVLYNTFTFNHEVAVKIVNSLLKACGFPNNVEFSSPEDMAKQLLNKTLIITVKHDPDSQDPSKKYPKAKYYKQSKLMPPTAIEKPTISDEDLPF